MRVLLSIVLCCVASIQITQSQSWRYAGHNPLRLRHEALRRAQAGQEIGPIHFHGVVGKLPAKYIPLTPTDEKVTAKAATIISTFIKFIPEVFTLHYLEPINVDLPDINLRGKLTLSNLVLRHLNHVFLQHLEMRTLNKRIDFSVHGPRISADVNFNFEGNLGSIPLHLGGSVNLKVQDMDPVGAVGAKKVLFPGVGLAYQLDSADVSVDIQSLNIIITTGNNSNLQKDADTLKAQTLHNVKDELANAILREALKAINTVLAKIPAEIIDNLLKPDN